MVKISVVRQHDRGFIYNIEDYLELRFTHRIIVLSPYELKLALKKGWIHLVDKRSLSLPPDDSQQAKIREMIEQQLAEQREPFVEKRLAEFRRHLPKIIEGKRKKLLKTQMIEDNACVDPEQLVNDEKQRIELMEIDKLIQIPLEHPLPGAYSMINDESIEVDALKYRIFEDIWENHNFYISSGDSFGGDFLLYPGDPLYYHASHVVHVLATHQLDVKYLIRCCRLSVVVNKICIFVYEDEHGKINYQTMEWIGNVDNDNN
ncbi:uncharacterized protein LOC129769539 isoform X2 [Toxorhynchites rutilus septentrionalis]|uniref:uncharacterized protein LOC129769539 isoform X2 n=1 Tax=Toxorhynchites rutilus septentrionalis TaxID=329112 RepID=UPI00247AF239|nr:uncharacterized protein LOC129769539 isoform X2 [Toxorhynchites rutilus septentrionalis]